MEPRNGWQNEKTPPSAATMRYPGPDPQLTEAPSWRACPELGSTMSADSSTASNALAGTCLSSLTSATGPAVVRRPAEVPVGAVVGQDQPVLLHGAQHHLGLGRVARDVVAGLEPEAGPHGRQVRVGRRPRLVAGRPQVRRVRRLGRHPDGVGDDARLHLVVAHEAREDRQAGRVGRRPAGRAQRVRVRGSRSRPSRRSSPTRCTARP